MTRRTGNLRADEQRLARGAPRRRGRAGAARRARRSRVRSRRGQIQLPVQITPRIEPGHVFTAFHFPEVRTNLLIGQSSDVNTSCPEYKVVAVAIEPVGDRVRAAGARPAPYPPSRRVLKQVALDGGTDEVAVELPLEIRLNGVAGRGDDAHARARLRAGRGLPLRRGDRLDGARDDAARGPGGEHRGRRSRRARCRRPRGASTRPRPAGSAGRARSRRSRRSRRSVAGGPSIRARAARRAARPAAPADLRAHRRAARDRPVRRGRRAAGGARGRRPPQRDGQGDRARRCCPARCRSPSTCCA